MRRKNKFSRTPDVLLFTALWKEFRIQCRRDCEARGWINGHTNPDPETWKKYGPRLRAAWREVARTGLGPLSWKSLELFLKWWDVRRRVWLEPGNVLFTKTGRKRKRKVKRPRNPSIQILDDGLTLAAESFEVAKRLEGMDSSLMVVILALAGSIYLGPGRNVVLYSRKEKEQ